MRISLRRSAAGLALIVPLLCIVPVEAEAQGRGNRDRAPASSSSSGISLSVELQAQIGDFYASNPASGVEALPPGIRRRLERGKALPPGIAKKSAPQIVEVGLDVLLVEVATNIVHDVLMDIIR